ncbi:hypothetical protein niasHT_033701 [Heterodera trifolii]|uniref:Uncharacterized protein n=1 Tax=Heterodera trifolii TaxID=157864 RepID=A0ABD2IJB5_9BILA
MIRPRAMAGEREGGNASGAFAGRPFQRIIRRGKRRRPRANPSPPARPTLCGESVLHAKQTCGICGPKLARMTHWPGKGMDKWQIGGGGGEKGDHSLGIPFL